MARSVRELRREWEQARDRVRARIDRLHAWGVPEAVRLALRAEIEYCETAAVVHAVARVERRASEVADLYLTVQDEILGAATRSRGVE